MLYMIFFESCRPEEDHYIYGLEDANISEVELDKKQEKNMTQYIAVLYTNLFQQSINPTKLQEIKSAIASIGDKRLAKRMVIGTFLRSGQAKVPSMEEMRDNIPDFIRETYIRFLVREPTQAELIYLSNFIESQPQLEPHIIYTTFALSDEYQFY